MPMNAPRSHLRICVLPCSAAAQMPFLAYQAIRYVLRKRSDSLWWRSKLSRDRRIDRAEPYVLQNVRDADTAQLLDMVARFKDRVAWHGESAGGILRGQ